jgi:hypothetical protein
LRTYTELHRGTQRNTEKKENKENKKMKSEALRVFFAPLRLCGKNKGEWKTSAFKFCGLSS